ncbi:Uncharacterised protein [Mycobacteroides abscessus subsp. abscessus]|nr:Uncharacterised protein [Mycobacteroides abscessus subsp. abscessus]
MRVGLPGHVQVGGQPPQPGLRRQFTGSAIEFGVETFEFAGQHRHQQMAFGSEMPIQGAGGNAGLRGHRTHLHTVKTLC